jgi:Fe2+ transport system protein FeoA
MAERNLRDLRPGEKGVVTKARGSGGAAKRLLDMGLVAGAPLEVIRVAPLGDPVEISVKGYNLTLRKEEAEGVSVEVE